MEIGDPTIIFLEIYRRPPRGYCKRTILFKTLSTVDRVAQGSSKIISMGDFNIDLVKDTYRSITLFFIFTSSLGYGTLSFPTPGCKGVIISY